MVGVRGPREMAAGPNLPRSWSTAWSSLRARSRFSSGEEGELLGLAVGEVTEGDAEQAEGAAVPEFGEEGFGAVIELLCDVAGLGEAALVGAVFEIAAADGDGEAETAAAVGAKAGGDAVAQGEQDLIGLRDGGDVLLEGGGVAIAFDGLGLGEDGEGSTPQA